VARLTLSPGILTQLRLVAWLRWRLFVNSLRTLRGKADLASNIILGALMGSVGLGFGLLLGIGSWFAISAGKTLILSAELWFVFLFWLLWPILVSGFDAESDPASLLRFPLQYGSFVVLAFAHGVFDHVALVALYWLTAMLAGIALASPGALPRAVSALAGFALFNLLLNRTLFAWLSRWLAQRRTREILGVVLVLVMFSFQLVGPFFHRYGEKAFSAITRLASFARLLPPGMAATTITAPHAGQAWGALAGLLAYSAVLAWLLSIRLRAEYRGENLSEARQPTAQGHSEVRVGWNVAGISPTVAALFEKDLRYLLRNTMAYFTLLAPLMVVVVMSLNHGGAHPRHPVFWRSSSILFPLSLAYVIVTLANFLYNSLGYDGPGLPMLVAAPIRFCDVLAAKNLLYSLVFGVECFAVFVLVEWGVGRTPPLVVAVALAGALWAWLTNLTAGNLASLYLPFKMIPGEMRRHRASGLAVAASLGAQVLLAGLAATLYFLSRWAGHLGWCGVAFLVLAGVAATAYRRVLDLSSGIAWKRREALMAQLSGSG
jgi:ABC-2 type transport system permease protein